eukprot:TRINITY_DN20144_c3_g2_i1.p1 TRINITY_DN20144_c3_g2~~TRINITY_DN20144_c3_g2_i1.p1  ORF type:complete len:274 (+),score=50.60 TRINITY_DN20144_c3_g2_i1:55-876(+)
MRICAMWRDICRRRPLTPSELRWYLERQLVIFSIINTTLAMINLFVQDNSAIEEGAIIVSLVLVWLTFPMGLLGAMRENSGVLALYIVFGILCGACSTVLSIVAAATVAISCQSEQLSFRGCKAALGGLPCLEFSNCTSSMIEDYNTLFPDCDAWGTDDCKNAPDTLTSLAFLGERLFLLILNVFTSCIPVYFAILFFMRLEASRSHDDSDDENSDDESTTHSDSDCSNSPDVEVGIKKPTTPKKKKKSKKANKSNKKATKSKKETKNDKNKQ